MWSAGDWASYTYIPCVSIFLIIYGIKNRIVDNRNIFAEFYIRIFLW